jgi:hypothetical protein
VCFAVVPAHVILVGDAYPKGDALDLPPIWGVLELFNTILFKLKSLTRELYPSPFV